ncbi:ankyrin repeat domain-containing protein [Elizabethkingia anophelis]|nr:ankyrin repeat domain-containing protein [Elizabethkingia anophelis]MCT3958500.1 ankyrin repeat domain-containing protein [Elizabethkingia anophelis]
MDIVHKELINYILFNDEEAVKSLIDNNVSLDEIDEFGRTVIFDAIIKGYDNIVKVLCDANVNVNVQDRQGKSPLHFAAIYNNISIVEILVEAGANINLRDINGNNPLFDAVFNSKGSSDLIIFLLKNGADYQNKNNFGVSAKSLAETIGNFDVAYLFI